MCACLTQSGDGEGVNGVEGIIISILVSVATEVIGYYICKWLDSYIKGK